MSLNARHHVEVQGLTEGAGRPVKAPRVERGLCQNYQLFSLHRSLPPLQTRLLPTPGQSCSFRAGQWLWAYKHPSFYCSSQMLVFYKWEVCGNPALNKSVGTIFPRAHFVSLCCILAVPIVFGALSLLRFLWWCVISALGLTSFFWVSFCIVKLLAISRAGHMGS